MKNLIVTIAIFTTTSLSYSQTNPRLDTLKSNSAINLGRYICTTMPTDYQSCVGITAYSGFIYDNNNHQMLQFGGGHATTLRDDINVFSFDSLSWTSAYPTTQCTTMTALNVDTINGAWLSTGNPISRHTYDLLAITKDSGEFVIMRGVGNMYPSCANSAAKAKSNNLKGKIAHYNPKTKTWRYSAASPKWSPYAACESDPISGNIIVMDRNSTWVYDPIAETTVKILNTGGSGIENTLVYYPPNDKFYYIALSYTSTFAVYELTPIRTNWALSTIRKITTMGGSPPVFTVNRHDQRGWAYDSVNQIIGGGIENGVFYTYNPISNNWTADTILNKDSEIIRDIQFHTIDYDPINNVYIFMSTTSRIWEKITWAYRYKKSTASLKENNSYTKIKLSVFPNPFNSTVAISSTAVLNDILIYNLAGKLVHRVSPDKKIYLLDAEFLPAGVYILKAKSDNYIMNRKFIRE